MYNWLSQWYREKNKKKKKKKVKLISKEKSDKSMFMCRVVLDLSMACCGSRICNMCILW